MRYCKLLLMGGIVLALSMPAWGTTIPFRTAWNGPVYMHLQNFDDSVVYDYNGGFLADGTTPIVLGTAYNVGLVKTFAAMATMPGESSWGIFSIDSIQQGAIQSLAANRINSTGPFLFVSGDSGLEVVGIFSGGADQTVTFTTTNVAGDTQTIASSGYDINFYTQPVNTFDQGVAGATARTALGNYPTIGFTAADAPIVGSELVLSLVSQPGIETQEFLSTFIPDASGSGNGSFNFYASVTGGSMALQFDTNVFPCGTGVASIPGTTADIRFKGTSDPTDPNLWLVHSSDPTTGAVIPEPVTMAGLLMGLGCLGRYIRKRR